MDSLTPEENEHLLTRAERRALKKQRGKERSLLEKKQTKSKAFLGWTAFIGITVLALVGVYYLATYNSLPPMGNPLEITEADQIKGETGAKLTLIEYSDFQCPACRAYYSMVKTLEETFGEDLAVVYRQFPLRSIHPNALPSALAAEAAGKQGKFWEMHDKLFLTQTEWSNLSNPKSRFAEYAESLGLNIDQFEKDTTERETKIKVETDIKTGTMLKVQGTPSFFLNGTKIENPRSEEAFIELIQQKLDTL